MSFRDIYGAEYSDDMKLFNKCSSSLTEYSILEGAESIGSAAFKDCTNLKTLTLPASIKKVQSSAFSGCKNLTKLIYNGTLIQWLSITWDAYFDRGYDLYIGGLKVENIIVPDEITIIQKRAFYYCKSLTNVIFNKNIVRIEEDAFNKSGLKGILSIPRNCGGLGNHAFFNCDGITKVKISDSTWELGSGVFSACYNIEAFVVSEKNRSISSDGVGLFRHNITKTLQIGGKSVLVPGGKDLISLASASSHSYTLPTDVTSIEKDACCYSSIPKSGLYITHDLTIDKDAFRNNKRNVFVPFSLKRKFLNCGINSDLLKSIITVEEAKLDKSSPLSFIANNPYRVLGVFADASQREIQTNVAKIKRFLEIGKQPQFENDFNLCMPPLTRTVEMIDGALAMISNPNDRLKYGLFWITKPKTEEDNNELQQLVDDRIIRSKESSILHSFCANRFPFFGSKNIIRYRDLKASIFGENCEGSREELIRCFVDVVRDEIDPICLWESKQSIFFLASDESSEYLYDCAFEPLFGTIRSEIAKSKSIDDKKPKEALKAANTLVNNTKESISKLDDHLEKSDVKLVTIHDTLADRILQLSIDCYNNSEPEDVAREVFELMKTAKGLAIGEITFKRCEDNLNTVKKVVDGLPPKGLEGKDKELRKIINKYRNKTDSISEALSMLKEVNPIIVEIKDLADNPRTSSGLTKNVNPYLTRISSTIANVCLNKLIEEANNSKSIYTFERAWDIICILNQLPLDPDFLKQRYNENVSILAKNLSGGVHFMTKKTNEKKYNLVDFRSEMELWKASCYEKYLCRYPKGRYALEARKRLDAIKAREAKQKAEREAKEAAYRERLKLEKREKLEAKILWWVIGILIVLIIFQIIFIFGGYDAIGGTLGVIAFIAFLGAIGWIRDSLN